MICVVMGVSGSGKSTIGGLLSHRLGWPFFDGDDFHSPENIAKMACGIALEDSDRIQWLSQLKQLIDGTIEQENKAIIACSALKSSYRQEIQGNHQNKILWVYLQGSYEQIKTRLQQRTGHFMTTELLKSQFATLEEPGRALIINISLSPEAIVQKIVDCIQNS